MGYDIYKEYNDHESGGTSNRPAFNQMFADASKRRFDIVLFWSLDRFSREGARKTIFLLQQLDDYGILYKSYTEQFIDSSGIFRDVLIALMASLALQEKRKLADRVLAGLEVARRKGRIGGRPRIPQDKVEMIDKLKQSGLSLRKIAKQVDISHRTVWMYLNN
jgi:DNA invertase Pin-like site-specific DNA recombinase